MASVSPATPVRPASTPHLSLSHAQGASLKRAMAQQPPDSTPGLAVVDENMVSMGRCSSSSQAADTARIVGDGASSNSKKQQQQQEEEEEEDAEKEEAPVSAAAAPVSTSASGPAGDPGPGQSLLTDMTSQQQQQQQQQQQEALCIPHTPSELTPAKRSAPPSMAMGSNGGSGSGGGIGIIGTTGGGGSGTAGEGDSGLRCFNKLAAMIPGPPLRSAAVHCNSSRRNSNGDLQRSASSRLAVAQDTATSTAVAAVVGHDGEVHASGSRMGFHGRRAATSTSSTGLIRTLTGGRSRHDIVGVRAAAPPSAIAAAATKTTAAVTGVNSHVPHPRAAAGAEDQLLSGNDRRSMRDGVGGVSYSPKLPPAAYVAGWSYSGASGALNTSSVSRGLRPITPVPPFSAAHRWGPSLEVSQGSGIAPNVGAAALGWPQGYLPSIGGWMAG